MRGKYIFTMTLCFLLITGCTSNKFSKSTSIDIGDNFDVNFMNVNEIGVFGVIRNEGIGYYDFKNKKNIAILKNEKEEITPMNTQGVSYYQNKIYFFDSHKNSACMVMDTDGKNQKKLFDLADAQYNHVLVNQTFIYNKGILYFETMYVKLNPDSSKNQEWMQLMLYDMSTKEIIPITNKEQRGSEKEAMLIASIEDQVFYFTSYKDENILSMSDYEKRYKSTLNYSFYLDEHTGKKVYAYNRKTKEVEKLVEGKGIDFAHQNAKYKNSLVYRQGNDLKRIDIKTKEITTLYTIANLETIRATLDDKVFFSTLNDKTIYIYYYDFITKKITESQKHEFTSGTYFYPNFATKEYFVGMSGEKKTSFIKKEDFYNNKFDQLLSMGW